MNMNMKDRIAAKRKEAREFGGRLEPVMLTPEEDKQLREILGISPGEELFNVKVSTSASDTYFESQFADLSTLDEDDEDTAPQIHEISAGIKGESVCPAKSLTA